MDKQMINIDDLVRQRLGNTEDRESTGGWLQMREMLDQKMPVNQQVGGFNWRRVFGIMTGVAIFASLTVGGYRMITTTDFRNGSDKEAIASSESFSARPNATGISSVNSKTKDIIPAANNSPVTESGNKTDAYTSSDHKVSEGKKIDGLKKANSKHSSDNNADNQLNNTTNHTTTNGTNTAAGVAANAAETSGNDVENQTASSTNLIVSAIQSNTVTASDGTISENANAPENLESLNSVSVTKPATAIASGNKTSETEINNHKDVKFFAASEKPASIVKTAEPDNARVAPAPTEPELRKDTFRMMKIVQRYVINPRERTRQVIVDTISTERIIVDKINLDQLAEKNEETGTAIAKTGSENERPFVLDLSAAQNAKLVTLDNIEFIPLSTQKVKARKTDNWNAKSFNEVMRDVKFNLAQIRFYPGIIGGANWQKFGAGHLLGFHLGLTGQFTYGEQWSMMAELKYMQRKNNGTTLNDNYVEIKEDNGQFLQRSVEHFFKFANLQSLELPVSLRFAMGRLNLIGGINMAYHFAVNAEEGKYPEEKYSPAPNPDWSHNRPTIKYDDFKARFALGGLVGISYQVSPSLQLDIRTVKTFFDTAPVNGSYKVSQLLYMPASFQISAGYRFSQKDGIPKAR